MRNTFVSFAVSDMMVDALRRAAELNDANLAYALLRKICVVEDLTLPISRKLNKTAQTILDLASQDQSRFRERIDEREEKRARWRNEKARKIGRSLDLVNENSNGIPAEVQTEFPTEKNENSAGIHRATTSTSNSTSRESGISAEIPAVSLSCATGQEEENGWWRYFREHWTHWGNRQVARKAWHDLWVSGALPPLEEFFARMKEQGEAAGWCARPDKGVCVPSCEEYLLGRMWEKSPEKKAPAAGQRAAISLDDL